MSKPKIHGGKTKQSRHLRRYVKEVDCGVESGQPADIITVGLTVLSESRPAINYILGGPSDDQYQSKRQ